MSEHEQVTTTAPAPTYYKAPSNPVKTAGAWLLALGIVSALGAGLAGILALGEFSRYASLVRSGNPFAAMVSNSGIYLLGTAAVAGLLAVGFIILGAVMSSGRIALVEK